LSVFVMTSGPNWFLQLASAMSLPAVGFGAGVIALTQVAVNNVDAD
jgi:hypothetical protein